MSKFVAAVVVAALVLVAGPASAHHRPGPCPIHWMREWRENRNVQPIRNLIVCATRRWSVPGGTSKALAVASCESGFRPDAYSNGNAGVFQHRVPYWPARYRDFTQPWWRLADPARNGRTNVIVSVVMIHRGGWGPWEGGSCA